VVLINSGSFDITVGQTNTASCGTTSATLETALTDGIDNADRKLITETRLVRMAYNSASDATIYCYYRNYTLAGGKVINISNETRVTLAQTADGAGCPDLDYTD
jgi:hypothetical protein